MIFIVYSFSDFFQGVPDSTFFSAVITLLVIGTIVARHLDRKKSLKNTSQI
ncbi:putative inner membrane protein [Escherichia coli DEC14B]|nr:putative inner membrane protein [Escherichia coli DEC14B]